MRTLFAAASLCTLLSACDMQSMPIHIPIIPEGASNLRPHRHFDLTVTIDRHGDKSIANRPIKSHEAMCDAFTQLLSDNPLSAITIRADARAPFEAITDTMLLARKTGISRIYLIVGERGRTETGPIVVEQSILLDVE